MVFIGMDHGTTGISFTILHEKPVHFKIGRDELSAGEVSAVEELSKRVDLDSIQLMAITYARARESKTIVPCNRLKPRGVSQLLGA